MLFHYNMFKICHTASILCPNSHPVKTRLYLWLIGKPETPPLIGIQTQPKRSWDWSWTANNSYNNNSNKNGGKWSEKMFSLQKVAGLQNFWKGYHDKRHNSNIPIQGPLTVTPGLTSLTLPEVKKWQMRLFFGLQTLQHSLTDKLLQTYTATSQQKQIYTTTALNLCNYISFKLMRQKWKKGKQEMTTFSRLFPSNFHV